MQTLLARDLHPDIHTFTEINTAHAQAQVQHNMITCDVHAPHTYAQHPPLMLGIKSDFSHFPTKKQNKVPLHPLPHPACNHAPLHAKKGKHFGNRTRKRRRVGERKLDKKEVKGKTREREEDRNPEKGNADCPRGTEYKIG